MKLFAFGFLPVADICTLQLVDSQLNTLIETHRRQLPRHVVNIFFDPLSSPPLTFEFQSSTPKRQSGKECTAPPTIAAFLHPRNVGRIHRLSLYGNTTGGEHSMAKQGLAERILVTILRIPSQIPITVVEIGQLASAMAGLRLESLPECLEVMGDREFSSQPAPYHDTPHLVYHYPHSEFNPFTAPTLHQRPLHRQSGVSFRFRSGVRAEWEHSFET